LVGLNLRRNIPLDTGFYLVPPNERNCFDLDGRRYFSIDEHRCKDLRTQQGSVRAQTPGHGNMGELQHSTTPAQGKL
jgi:hypothetical protein